MQQNAQQKSEFNENSLITNRFKYKSLKRFSHNRERFYITSNKDKLPSVTTILDKTSDKTHLHEWRKRVGEEQAKQILTEASGIGTRMHKFLETYIKTGEWDFGGTNPYSKKANKMAQIIKENALCDIDEFWGIEVSLYIPKLYAGTTDLVAVRKGNPCICDYKQTNKPKKDEWVDDYRLQLVAYAEAHNELYGTDIKEAHIFMCSRDYDYQLFSILSDNYEYWKNEWYNRLYAYYEKTSS